MLKKQQIHDLKELQHLLHSRLAESALEQSERGWAMVEFHTFDSQLTQLLS